MTIDSFSIYLVIIFFFLSFMSIWLVVFLCDSSLFLTFLLNTRLFFQQPGNFKRVMTLVSTVGIPTSGNYGDTKVSLVGSLYPV